MSSDIYLCFRPIRVLVYEMLTALLDCRRHACRRRAFCRRRPFCRRRRAFYRRRRAWCRRRLSYHRHQASQYYPGGGFPFCRFSFSSSIRNKIIRICIASVVKTFKTTPNRFRHWKRRQPEFPVQRP